MEGGKPEYPEKTSGVPAIQRVPRNESWTHDLLIITAVEKTVFEYTQPH